jgi:hypothetical protein
MLPVLVTLGAASTLKRKLKPSKSAEKETTKVGYIAQQKYDKLPLHSVS